MVPGGRMQPVIKLRNKRCVGKSRGEILNSL